jgi:hypothetical protein
METMTPQMLNVVASCIVFAVGYCFGNIEQELDKAEGQRYYLVQGSAIYVGTPAEREEVRAEVVARLGWDFAAMK